MRTSFWLVSLGIVLTLSGSTPAQEAAPDSIRFGDISLSASRFRDVTAFTTTFNRSVTRLQGLSYALGWASMDQGNTTLARNQKSRGASLAVEYGFQPWLKPFLRAEGLASSDAGTGYANRTYRTSAQVGVRLVPLSNLSISPAFGAISERFHTATGGPETVRNNSGHSRSLTVTITPVRRFPLDGKFSESLESQGLLTTHEVSGMGSVSRVLFTRQSLRADLEGFRGKYSYPLGSTSEEKKQRMSRLRLSWELVNLKRIQGGLSETHSQESYAYASPDASLRSPAKDYAKKEDVLLGTLGYRPWESLEGSLLLRRAQSKNNYPNQPINTQVLDSKHLEARAQARPNSISVLEFVQTLGLDSYDFPHPFNFNARDLGSASSFFRSTILVSKTTRIGASVLARQDHLVYIRPEMSANNRWTRSYQVAPLLSFTPFPWLLWTQSYALRADYNLYDYASRSNLLLRSITVQDSLRFARPGKEDNLLLSLGAQVQSQGPYLYDQASQRYGYYTSQENARYSVGLSAVRRVRGMRITPGYFYERRRITDFLPDTSYTRLLPSLRSRVIVQDLTLGAELAPWHGSSLSLAVTRSLRQGEQSYWDARLLLDWKI